MNVMQFICSTGFYGAERWVLALANNLHTDNLQCHLLQAVESPSERNELAESYPTDIGSTFQVNMNSRFDPLVIKKITDIIKSNNIDIVHTHGYKSDILGLIAAKICRIKCISTPHGLGTALDFKLKTYIKLGGYALRYFDSVAPLSPALVNYAQMIGVKPERIEFIPNGVDLAEAEFTSSTVTQPESFEKKIGFLGRFVPGKEIPDILNVFNEIWKSNNNVSLELIGDGEQRTQIETLAKTLPCASNIAFLGFRPDRLKLMKEFNLFLMTSSSEGIPRSLMEAMALGIPVAAYDIPGVDQLVIHGKTGLLATLYDTDTLAKHSKQLLFDQKTAKAIGVAGKEHIVNNYSASSMASNYTTLYARLLSDS